MKATLIDQHGDCKIYKIHSKSGKFYAFVETTDELNDILKYYKGKKKPLGSQIKLF
jgi:hypothetical protein